ncbi:DUF805 domain-containing protein [Actibacterium sp. 188UL27-1]|uniref:DUF805 domain-containing protein n=1 Tax=Actibacterium sp. 188UL27-1 TaxID=2786961 RepID=UPI001959C189|nr:DUF805 domain-containing protein [Actibacterium sp. 188UL27-1]MBM7068354.1 DUF805 domain-containing protein [Actibacterium sp. 188UL27-1]
MRMTFLDAIKTCMAKYVTISGRASRAEFWWFYLFTILVQLGATALDAAFFGWDEIEDVGPLELITTYGLFIPIITATIRRLHDTNRSGWYILVPILTIGATFGVGALSPGLTVGAGFVLVLLIGLSGFLLQLYWLSQPSDPGSNTYGPNPYDALNDANLMEVFK